MCLSDKEATIPGKDTIDSNALPGKEEVSRNLLDMRDKTNFLRPDRQTLISFGSGFILGTWCPALNC